MMPQPSEAWDELLAGYVLGDLTPEEAVQVKQYLDTHPQQASEVKALQATLSLLPLALPETTLSPSLGSDLVRTAETLAAKVPERAFSLPQPRWKRWGMTTGGILAALLTIGLGYDSYRLRNELSLAQVNLQQQQSRMAAQTRQSGDRLFVLNTTSNTQAISGSLVVAPKRQLVLLAIQNLKPLPAGQVYRLWGVSHGKKMNCIDFSASPTGQVFLQMPLDEILAQTPTVFITVESAESHTTQKGTTVMLGNESI